MQIFQNSFRHFGTLAHFGDAQSKMIAPLICVAFIVFINTRKCAAASRTANCIKRVRAQTQIASGNCSTNADSHSGASHRQKEFGVILTGMNFASAATESVQNVLNFGTYFITEILFRMSVEQLLD